MLSKPLSIDEAFSKPLGNQISWEDEDILNNSDKENTEKKSNRKIGNGSILKTI